MFRRSIITGVVVGVGILFAVSIYTVVWSRYKRRKRSLPDLVSDIMQMRCEAVRLLDEHPQRLDRALETSFQQYAQHTLIMEGIPADEVPISSIRDATNYVINQFAWGHITEGNIRTVHAHVMLRENPNMAGQFRDHDVFIRGRDGSISTFPHHTEVPALMEEFITWLNQQSDSIENRFVVAAEAKLRYVLIHPHSDGNGRTSRAIMAGLLCQIPAIPYVAIPYQKGQEYFAEIRQADQTHNPENFIKFVLRLVEQAYETFNKDLSSDRND